MTFRTTLVLTLVLLPSTVHASPEEKARALFSQGKAAYDKASYPEALDKFQGALKLIHRASLLLMTARTYRRLNRADKALTYYESYKSVWRQENPKKPSPHTAEVTEQLTSLAETTRLVTEAEASLRKGLHVEAINALNLALKGSSWPRIYAVLARCYLALDRRDKATASVKVALGYWEGYRLGWKTKHPGTLPPDDDHAAVRVKALKALEQEILKHGKPIPAAAPTPGTTPTPAPAASPVAPKPPPEPSAEEPPQRNTLLLGLGISALGLALAAEGLTWAAYAEGHELEAGDDFDKYQALYISGHILAGALAVTSGVLFYLWYASGEPAPAQTAGFTLLPLPGGAAVSGGFRF